MTLSAGPFEMKYENGFLRYIRYGENEVLRMIYFALRNENWSTLPIEITVEKHFIETDQFKIEYTCANKIDDRKVFSWNISIRGTSDGTITFELEGEALEDIKKNRVGFCVLHPIKESVGQPIVVTHPDNTITHSAFPTLVSPENPFKNVRKLKWKNGDAWFEVLAEGDVYETEDQRNWTDASFKTFCTPQHLPIPVQLRAGDKVSQKITFKSTTPLPRIQKIQTDFIELRRTDRLIKFPAVGICASTEQGRLSQKALDKIRSVGFDHYRIEVSPAQPHWVTQLSNDYEQAFELKLPLTIALHLSGNYEAELEAFVQLCLQNRVKIKSILLLSAKKPVTDQLVIDKVLEIKKSFPKVQVGAGTDYNFTELNRNRFQHGNIDFVSYTVQPQVHAIDDLSLIENLQGQTETAITAKNIYSGCLTHISPITLKKRISSYSSSAPSLPEEQKADPRQKTDFGAVWTFGSLQAIAKAGADSATYYQTAGNQGIVSENGEAYPVFEVFKNLLANRGKQMVLLENSHPLLVDGMLFSEKGYDTLWLANYSNTSQSLIFENNKIELKPREIRSERLNSAQQL
jgi:hypothetical protein